MATILLCILVCAAPHLIERKEAEKLCSETKYDGGYAVSEERNWEDDYEEV
jgi:hypothetical protein